MDCAVFWHRTQAEESVSIRQEGSILDFILREWAQADAEAVCKYANNKLIADNLRNGFPHPYMLDDAKAFIKTMMESGEKDSFCRAIDVGGEAVGSIGLFVRDAAYRRCAEIGYWLGEPFWGNGIISAAIAQICDIGFSRYDIVRIYAEPYAYNMGSRRALEKNGFALEGILKKGVYRNGEIIDSCMYALIK